MLFESENQAFLDAAGYDHLDPGEDIVHPPWKPSEFAMAAYRKRDLELARANVNLLAARAEPRRRVVITNGAILNYEELTERQAALYREPFHCYRAVLAWAGGPDQEDCLHLLGTFGAAQRPHTVQLAGVARPVRRPTAA